MNFIVHVRDFIVNWITKKLIFVVTMNLSFGVLAQPTANEVRHVHVRLIVNFDGLKEQKGSGTIIAVDRHGSTILTCAHVVQCCKQHPTRSGKVAVEGGRTTVRFTNPRVLAYNWQEDLAIVHTTAICPHYAVVAPKNYTFRGPITICGSPLGKDPEVTRWPLIGQSSMMDGNTALLEVKGPQQSGTSGGGMYGTDKYLSGVLSVSDRQQSSAGTNLALSRWIDTVFDRKTSKLKLSAFSRSAAPRCAVVGCNNSRYSGVYCKKHCPT